MTYSLTPLLCKKPTPTIIRSLSVLTLSSLISLAAQTQPPTQTMSIEEYEPKSTLVVPAHCPRVGLASRDGCPLRASVGVKTGQSAPRLGRGDEHQPTGPDAQPREPVHFRCPARCVALLLPQRNLSSTAMRAIRSTHSATACWKSSGSRLGVA